MTFRSFENTDDQHRERYLEGEVWIRWQRLVPTDVSESFARFLETERIDVPITTYAEISQSRSAREGDEPGAANR